MSLEICEGSSVTVGTNVYTTSGVYSDTYCRQGCDSVVNLTLLSFQGLSIICL
ncbi:MAG: hypothetical protein IPO64_03855 [Bacteroidetes bacterium]|nr:hypothetical protein [Bacteroidota bacterium]